MRAISLLSLLFFCGQNIAQSNESLKGWKVRCWDSEKKIWSQVESTKFTINRVEQGTIIRNTSGIHRHAHLVFDFKEQKDDFKFTIELQNGYELGFLNREGKDEMLYVEIDEIEKPKFHTYELSRIGTRYTIKRDGRVRPMVHFRFDYADEILITLALQEAKSAIIKSYDFETLQSTNNKQDNTYGNRLKELHKPLLERLASNSAPGENGAIGRNKKTYFHVRFQLGMHHLAHYGLATKNKHALERFVKAAEYAFAHQTDDGGFEIVVPDKLKKHGKPSAANLASGAAFFLSSFGSGWLELEASDWFQSSQEFETLRQRMDKLKPKINATVNYLLRHKVHLEKVDEHAPNRLLFDALAFYTLGKIVDQAQAIEVATYFVKKAFNQVHEDGYFLEGGGFDSSYNGVAAALALRLKVLGYDQDGIESICKKSIDWQVSRILKSGEIDTTGNTRVRSDGEGESFLGRKKDVDVKHTIEALVLAAICFGEDDYAKLAKKVISFYLYK